MCIRDRLNPFLVLIPRALKNPIMHLSYHLTGVEPYSARGMRTRKGLSSRRTPLVMAARSLTGSALRRM